MAISNHERVGKALELLKNGLRPFVERAEIAFVPARCRLPQGDIARRTIRPNDRADAAKAVTVSPGRIEGIDRDQGAVALNPCV